MQKKINLLVLTIFKFILIAISIKKVQNFTSVDARTKISTRLMLTENV